MYRIIFIMLPRIIQPIYSVKRLNYSAWCCINHVMGQFSYIMASIPVLNVCYWLMPIGVSKFGKYLQVRHTLLLSYTVILDVCRSFIPIKTTFAKYCLSKCILKLPGCFEIHWVRQYLVNFTGLAGIVSATIYKTRPFFTGVGHSKFS